MSQRPLNVVVGEIAILKQELDNMRKTYLSERAALTEKLRSDYEEKSGKIKSKIRRYSDQLSSNVVNQLMGKSPMPDTDNYGWVIKSIENQK